MKKIVSFAVFSLFLAQANTALADQYSCAKMVYKDGWLKTYEYKGNTWGANTKKHGAVSSTVGSSTEQTTASFDPGVTTGGYMSSSQYSSSWGECSMLEYHITKQMREEYIDQNLQEIKKQVALGEGNHVDALAYLSGCKGIEKAQWKRELQGSMERLYDAKTGASFAGQVSGMIQQNADFSKQCQLSI